MHGLKQTKKLLRNMQSARLLKKRQLRYLGTLTPLLHLKSHLAPNLQNGRNVRNKNEENKKAAE